MTLSRRTVVKSIAAGVPLATILADPRLARAVAATLEPVSITTASGRRVIAAFAHPAKSPAPAVLVIHEWWGLNDQIKSVAAKLAEQGYAALAIDLFGGKVPQNEEEASALTHAVAANPKAAIETLTGWTDWLRKSPAGTGKVATLGYCFGGGWSLNCSLATPIDATVIYYGNVRKTAAELASLRDPVLLHYGLLDKHITTAMVTGFEEAAKKAGKSVTVYAYEANHAFANPTRGNYSYVREAADLAWQRTLAFLHDHIA